MLIDVKPMPSSSYQLPSPSESENELKDRALAPQKRVFKPDGVLSHPQADDHLRAIVYEVQDLVNWILGVPLARLCCGTVKHALDRHPMYVKEMFATRSQQVQQLLKDTDCQLSVWEFWQEVYNSRRFSPTDRKRRPKTELPDLKQLVQAVNRQVNGHQVRELVNRILNVPLDAISCGTVKQALDHHPRYTKERYPTRAQQTKQLLKDYDSPLTIREFWQGVYTARKVQPLAPAASGKNKEP